MTAIDSEHELVGLALSLGAAELGPLSPAERSVAARGERASTRLTSAFAAAIARGGDPLGEAFSRLRTPRERRKLGATYTPEAIVHAMTAWGAAREPIRVVDPGSGSARFLCAAGRALPSAELVGIEIDPLAALIGRAQLVTAGFAGRARIVLADYRELVLPPIAGRTLFLGNPPYVRHHLVAQRWKVWLSRRARTFGLRASRLAGLHAHFWLATALKARAGDAGVLITAAEWLDVNYGELVRALLLGPLGLRALTLIEPSARVFADADATAVVAGFEVGTRPARVRVRTVASIAALAPLERGRPLSRERLESTARWSQLTRGARARRAGQVELGELCRVHRGQVTGANRIWIEGAHSAGLPDEVLFPCVTRARELFRAEGELRDLRGLRRVIDLPVDLDLLSKQARVRVERFLAVARRAGAKDAFVARHRRAWWSVGLREPAPILATYMARRPPAFVRNFAQAHHLNIAHGLYPRQPLSDAVLRALARHLARSTVLADGRTYAGGLTKFEPREMERLLVPAPELLAHAQPDTLLR